LVCVRRIWSCATWPIRMSWRESGVVQNPRNR